MTALNPVHTIGKQICEVLTQHNELDPDVAWNRAVEMLDKVGIPSPEIVPPNIRNCLEVCGSVW